MAKRKKDRRKLDISATNDPSGGALAAGLGALGFRASAAGSSPTPATSESKAARRGKVVVRKERAGRRGKTVTVVSGLGGDLPAEAKALKRALGCGAVVEGEDVVLQGDLRERVHDRLVAAGRKVVVGN